MNYFPLYSKALRNLMPFCCSLLFSGGIAHGIIANLNDSTDNWTAIEYAGQSDYYSDTQANKEGGDIIGDPDNNQSGFYKRYDAGGVGTADDVMAFRFRVGDVPDANFFIGIDVGGGVNNALDGAIDFYIGVSPDSLAFYDPGTGANTSPSTSTFSLFSTYKTDADSDFDSYVDISQVVLGGNEGYSGLDASDDLNQGSTVKKPEPDYFKSFQVEMSEISAAYQAISGTTNVLTADTEMMFVVGTSNNGNNFNQDFVGIDGKVGEDLLWTDEAGVGAPIYTADGTSPVPEVVVPEPATSVLLLGLCAGALALTRRR